MALLLSPSVAHQAAVDGESEKERKEMRVKRGLAEVGDGADDEEAGALLGDDAPTVVAVKATDLTAEEVARLKETGEWESLKTGKKVVFKRRRVGEEGASAETDERRAKQTKATDEPTTTKTDGRTAKEKKTDERARMRVLAKTKAVKNATLLSFGDDDEDGDDE